jgi:hypothetical protein
MARANQKGRRRSGPPFLSLYHYILKSDAWRELTPQERTVLIQIAARFNGTNNGNIAASVRDLAEECNIAVNTVTKAIGRLISIGFIDRTQEGSFSYKVRHAAEYRLTWARCDRTGQAPRSLFMTFRRGL